MTGEGETSGRVWLVMAIMTIPYLIEDECYIVGVYSTKEKAQQAARVAIDEYPREPRSPNAEFSAEIHCLEIDEKVWACAKLDGRAA